MALYIGLMSGTSLDSLDAALVDIDEGGVALRHARNHPLPDALRLSLLELTQEGPGEIERLGVADRQLGEVLAQAALALLRETGTAAADIAAIGSHGQTIRHRPPDNRRPAAQAFTLQIGDPNTIAQRTGITTVADFRRRDMAVGGQGAPLAPAFHRHAFHDPDRDRAVINIGGMANISFLPAEGEMLGFDSGPGNVLMDAWSQRCRQQRYDEGGRWAAGGAVDGELLKTLRSLPYFARSAGPKSTGREDFHPDILPQLLHRHPDTVDADVQATLLELTATTIADGVRALPRPVDEIYVCGGGAYNTALMHRLETLMHPARIATTAALGIAPEWVEAVAFAWLSCRRLEGLPGNMPAVTGASESVVLGAIYSA